MSEESRRKNDEKVVEKIKKTLSGQIEPVKFI